MNDKWEKRFLGIAKREISQWSKDPSTKVGCVIVDNDKNIVSTGINGFPRNVHDSQERLLDRDFKKKIIIHAEENALQRVRVDITGFTAFTNVPPCSKCTSLLINAGIKKIVTIKPTEDILKRYAESFEISKMIMKEAGVIYKEYSEKGLT